MSDKNATAAFEGLPQAPVEDAASVQNAARLAGVYHRPRKIVYSTLLGWNALAMALIWGWAIIAGRQEREHPSDPEGWTGLAIVLLVLFPDRSHPGEHGHRRRDRACSRPAEARLAAADHDDGTGPTRRDGQHNIGVPTGRAARRRRDACAEPVVPLVAITLVSSRRVTARRPCSPGPSPRSVPHSSRRGTDMDQVQAPLRQSTVDGSGRPGPERDRGRALAVAAGLAATLLLSACADAHVDSAGPTTPAPTSASLTPTTPPSPLPAPVGYSCKGTTARTGGAGDPVTAAEVCNATVNIPGWIDTDDPCPHGPVKLSAGRFPEPRDNELEGASKVVIADVDRDGRADAIVLATCAMGDPPTQEVFVVVRGASGGLRTVGKVVGPGNGIGKILDIAANPDGSVKALVSEVRGSVESAIAQEVSQWRTYAWNGRAFAQTAGSTSFDADTSATLLTMSARSIVFAKPNGKQRTATLTVRVTNSGGTPATAVGVLFAPGEGLSQLIGGSCPGGGDLRGHRPCPVGDIAPGESATVVITLTLATMDEAMFREIVGTDSAGVILLRLGDQRYSLVPAPSDARLSSGSGRGVVAAGGPGRGRVTGLPSARGRLHQVVIGHRPWRDAPGVLTHSPSLSSRPVRGLDKSLAKPSLGSPNGPSGLA